MRFARMPGETIQEFDKRSKKATEADVIVLDADMFSERHRCQELASDGYPCWRELKHKGKHGLSERRRK